MNARETLIMSTPLRSESGVANASLKLVPEGCGQSPKWVWAYASLIGSRHQQAGGVCEDAAAARVNPNGMPGGLHLALADGVSGGACGDIAAQALVNHCLDWNPESGIDLQDWIGRDAETAVQQALRSRTTKPGAATLAAAWLHEDGGGILTRIGDCRLYTWKRTDSGKPSICMEQVLPDQTMAYMGYAAPVSPRASHPAHMVGNQSTGTPELIHVALEGGDGLVFTSDGVHDVIEKEEIGNLLGKAINGINAAIRAESILSVCHQWLALAKDRGSDDDVSAAIIVRV